MNGIEEDVNNATNNNVKDSETNEKREINTIGIPENIIKVEDLFPYIKNVLYALLEESKYALKSRINNLDIIYCSEIMDIIIDAFKKEGFNDYTAKCFHHCFVWYVTKKRYAHHELLQNGSDKGLGVWVLEKEKAKEGKQNIDGLVNEFIKEYGGYLMAKIDTIRNDPYHTPY